MINRDSVALDDLFKRMQNFATIYWFAFYENLFGVSYTHSHLDSLIEHEINDGILLSQLKNEIFPAGENAMDADEFASAIAECAPWALHMKSLREKVISKCKLANLDDYDDENEDEE